MTSMTEMGFVKIKFLSWVTQTACIYHMVKKLIFFVLEIEIKCQENKPYKVYSYKFILLTLCINELFHFVTCQPLI